MAKVELLDTSLTPKKIRKLLKPYGLQYRRLFSWHIIAQWPRYKDPKSPAQLSCREKFKKAQEMMMEDFQDPEQIKWWNKCKVSKGYKTAKGCARAYYYHLLCQLELSQTDPTKRELKLYRKPKYWRDSPLYHLDFVGDNLTEHCYLYEQGKITFQEMWEWHVEDQKKKVRKEPVEDDDDDEDDSKRKRWGFGHFR